MTLSFTILPPVGEPTIIISDNSDGNTDATDDGSIDKKARLGSVVTITGTNFGAFEPIEIKFGQQQMSVNSLADGSFNSTFVIAEQPDGDVEVTVTGKISASTKTDAFTIEPAEGQPALEISDNSDGNTDATDEGSIDKKASNGDTLTLRGRNFGAEEEITVTFGTHTVYPLSNADGEFVAAIMIDKQVGGTQNIKAVGRTSSKTKIAAFKITPKITTFSPSVADIGQPVALQGNGFTANSNLRVLFGDSENSLAVLKGVVATTSLNGTFSTSVAIPIGPYSSQPDADKRIATFIRISDATGLSTGTELFVRVNMQQASLQLQPDKVTASTKLTLVGLAVSENGAPLASTNLGFLTLTQPNGTETTITSLANGLIISDQVGTLQPDNSLLSDSYGKVKVSFIVPSVDGGEAKVKFTAVENLIATFEILPELKLSVDGAKPGDSVSFSGFSYRSENTIQIALDGATLTTTPEVIQTDKQGGFSASFMVPVELPGGTVTITATDSVSKDATTVPTIAGNLTILGILDTPVDGAKFKPGDELNITGKGLSANETATITIGGVVVTEAEEFTTAANGSYDFTVAVPPLAAGSQKVRVSAGTNVAEGTISITPTLVTISPTEGSVGTRIDISGSGYTAGIPISVSIGLVEDVAFGNVSTNGEIQMEYIISRPQPPGEKTLTINVGDDTFYKGFTYKLDAEGPAIIKTTHDGGESVISKIGQIVTIKVIQRDDFDIAKRGTYRIGDLIDPSPINTGDLYNDGLHSDEGANDTVWAIPYQIPSGISTKVDGLPSAVPIKVTLFDALGNATSQETELPIYIDTIAEIKKLSVSGTGKYKVGDKMSITLVGEENASGTFQIAGVTGKEPLAQGMFANQYRASYTFLSGDRALNTKLTVELTDAYGNVSTQVSDKTISVEEVLQLNRVSLPTRLHSGDRFSVEFSSSSAVEPALSISGERIENAEDPEVIEHNWIPIEVLEYRQLESDENIASVGGLTAVNTDDEESNPSDQINDEEPEIITTDYIVFARIPPEVMLSSQMRLVRLVVSDQSGKVQTAEIPVDFYGLSPFKLKVPPGIGMIHIPLSVTSVNGKEATLKTVGDLYQILGGQDAVNLLITYDNQQGVWHSYLNESSRDSKADRVIQDDTGIITVMQEPVVLELRGRSLGNHGIASIQLSKGLNHVGIPLKTERVNRVSDLFALDGIKNNATAIIVPDQGRFKVVAAAGDDGDILITGGQSFIITAKGESQVRIGGMSWSDALRAELGTAPAILPQTSTPLLAIQGRMIDEYQQPIILPFEVTIRNGISSSDGEVDRTQSVSPVYKIQGETDQTGAFTATKLFFQPEQTIAVNDVLHLEAQVGQAKLRVPPIEYQVTGEDIQDGLIKLPNLVAYRVPQQSALWQNYPNPFNPETWIPYQLATDSQVMLKIYNSRGACVRTIDLGHQYAGHYRSRERAIYWNGNNEYGESVVSGVYFYTLDLKSPIETQTLTQKMIILK
ncbi:MAG: hypothetical protein QGI86_15370 [Candidatus Poribacteria bacterium]|nr:hypothetical protein [Candidatus Poribacteria bacterium]